MESVERAEGSSPSNVAEFSVSEISGAIKRTMEDSFGRVRVRGELGRVSRPASGHVYLDLKDERSVLAGVIWKGASAKMSIRPEEGLEVIATGRITTFAGQSKYQMVIDAIEPAGEGALMALLEERKRKLAAEGLFDQSRKRGLPYMPKTIGVVTSPTGAVIRDILHRLNDRFPVHVMVWPVRVQGETSAMEVASAINGFNQINGLTKIPRPDLLIVARGGGSIEDLWGFNEEVVVRAAAESQIPLISAVGHETDTTLIDFASDRRAPTPTGAAEIAVPVKAELAAYLATTAARLHQAGSQTTRLRRERLSALSRIMPKPETLLEQPRQHVDQAQIRLTQGLLNVLNQYKLRLSSLSAALSPIHVQSRIMNGRTRLDIQSSALPRALARQTEIKRGLFAQQRARLRHEQMAQTHANAANQLERAVQKLDAVIDKKNTRLNDRMEKFRRLLETLSYKSVLSRGFAVVRNAEGVPVSKSKSTKSGDMLQVEFADEDFVDVHVAGAAARSRAPKSKSAKIRETPATQAKLF
ncbi:MAG: exodeoxyribonuclease VII large subunit [Pseudomonadota bacterium]